MYDHIAGLEDGISEKKFEKVFNVKKDSAFAKDGRRKPKTTAEKRAFGIIDDVIFKAKEENLTIQGLFEKLDTQSRGKLRAKDLKNGLKGLKIITSDEADELVAWIDVNGTGAITLDEFEKAFEPLSETLLFGKNWVKELHEGRLLLQEINRILKKKDLVVFDFFREYVSDGDMYPRDFKKCLDKLELDSEEFEKELEFLQNKLSPKGGEFKYKIIEHVLNYWKKVHLQTLPLLHLLISLTSSSKLPESLCLQQSFNPRNSKINPSPRSSNFSKCSGTSWKRRISLQRSFIRSLTGRRRRRSRKRISRRHLR